MATTVYHSAKSKELARGQKVQVIFNAQKGGRIIVESPLPETYGVSAGSTYGTPFSGYATHGLIADLAAIKGLSGQYGLLTEKLYEGPLHTELSFEMKFDAWSDALKDVVVPSVALLINSTGNTMTGGDLLNHLTNEFKTLTIPITMIESIINKVQSYMTGTSGKSTSSGTNKKSVADLVKFMSSAPVCNVRFGELSLLRGVYLSSVSLQFSNVLDHNYMPMSCTASITGEYMNPLTQSRISDAFNSNIRRAKTGIKPNWST